MDGAQGVKGQCGVKGMFFLWILFIYLEFSGSSQVMHVYVYVSDNKGVPRKIALKIYFFTLSINIEVTF